MKDIVPTPPPNAAARPSIHLDVEDWLPYLAQNDISEAEKVKLIETLWTIVLSFVDLGWEIETDTKTGGQSLDLTAALRAAVVSSEVAPPRKQEGL